MKKILKIILFDLIIIFLIPVLIQAVAFLNFPQLYVNDYNFIDTIKSQTESIIKIFLMLTVIFYIIIVLIRIRRNLIFLPVIYFIFAVIFYVCSKINFNSLSGSSGGYFILDMIFEDIYKFPFYYSISLIPSAVIIYLFRKSDLIKK